MRAEEYAYFLGALEVAASHVVSTSGIRSLVKTDPVVTDLAILLDRIKMARRRQKYVS